MKIIFGSLVVAALVAANPATKTTKSPKTSKSAKTGCSDAPPTGSPTIFTPPACDYPESGYTTEYLCNGISSEYHYIVPGNVFKVKIYVQGGGGGGGGAGAGTAEGCTGGSGGNGQGGGYRTLELVVTPGDVLQLTPGCGGEGGGSGEIGGEGGGEGGDSGGESGGGGDGDALLPKPYGSGGGGGRGGSSKVRDLNEQLNYFAWGGYGGGGGAGGEYCGDDLKLADGDDGVDGGDGGYGGNGNNDGGDGYASGPYPSGDETAVGGGQGVEGVAGVVTPNGKRGEDGTNGFIRVTPCLPPLVD